MTSGKKYELTTETIQTEGKTLCRIRALREVDGASIGDLGGFVESEDNLSHEGECWIFEDSIVSGGARVEGDARVFGDSWLCDSVVVTDEVWIDGAWIYGTATLRGRAWIVGGCVC